MQGQGPSPVYGSSFLSPAMSLLGLSRCPFLNGKSEACPPGGTHGGRERTLLISTSTVRQEALSRGQWRVLLPPFCTQAVGGCLGGIMQSIEPFRANVCPSQMRPSYSLSLGTCWTWELPSARLEFLLPADQCCLLVPSTVQGGVREGFSAV